MEVTTKVLLREIHTLLLYMSYSTGDMVSLFLCIVIYVHICVGMFNGSNLTRTVNILRFTTKK